MQSRPNVLSLFFTVRLVGVQSAIVTFPGHTDILAKTFFKHDKILLLAKKAQELVGKQTYLSNNNDSVLLHMSWTFLTYAFSVNSIQLVRQLIIKFDLSVTHLLLFKEGSTRNLLVLRFVLYPQSNILNMK